MKEAAARMAASSGSFQSFLKNEIVSDQQRAFDSIASVSHLVGNLGQSDLATNYLLEQRNLLRSLAKENKDIREYMEEKIVDSWEHVRTKEQIAEAKARFQQDFADSSDDEDAFGHDYKKLSSSKDGESSSLTQDDSERAEKERMIAEQRIKNLIKTIRLEAQEYLTQNNDKAILEGHDVKSISLSKLCKKLRKNQDYKRKREAKLKVKGSLHETLAQTAEQLRTDLNKLDQQIDSYKTQFKTKAELQRVISQYEQIMGLDKRVNTSADQFDKSVAEVDAQPMNQRSFEFQNILFKYCGLDLKEENDFFKRPLKKDLFGNVKKVPLKSTILSSFLDGDKKTSKDGSVTDQVRKKGHDLVKVIGLEPEKLFSSVDKYRIQVHKMPKFSNIFERAEPTMPSVAMTIPGQVICQTTPGGQMTFARIDGRSVISLQFNPYFDAESDPQKKKELDQALKEIADQRDKVKVASKVNKEKQEQANIRKAWLTIVKRDIPRAFRQYQKFKADQENNLKKMTQNCLKEVKKKAIKTQRLQKECQLRAKKLHKDMITYWKKRDKENADSKRKKEKYERELRKRQEEEKEAVLQKKRLEFIMQQSEIYAHFMSKKLGLSDELKQQKQMDIDEENKDNFQRFEVDQSEARQNIASMINDNRSRVNDFDQETQQRKNHHGHLEKIRDEELEIDKFDNPDAAHSTVINPPKCFLGNLKHYQLKGLRWLDNLYEQGINGILADEMGLGKTIQAISLLAHLYENKGVWGPFLIIVPCTVLSNWQNELSKFCPTLKVLPFFGSPEERKKLGKFLDPKNLYNPNLRINVLLTSYNLIVNSSKDQQKLLRVKWHYMILDEAQAIKNNLSRRWRVLLQFNTRNRLLLTGTPIQNSMAELWALLHFIMPRLFDSHEQFQEWFSKDIEQHSLTDQGEINKHQLRRLHLVLKPFMLRRLKDDIELEIGPKTEYTHTCTMSHRQKVLYQRIKNKISTKDLFKLVESKSKMENLMNLVMQFRKVCNHPELFERRIGRIPLTFKELQIGMQPNPLLQSVPDLKTLMKNPIKFEVPKLVYDECFLISDNPSRLFRKLGKHDEAFAEVGIETHMKFFNIFNTGSLYRGAYEQSPSNIYSAVHLLARGNKWSHGEVSWMCVADPIVKQVALMHYYHEKYHKKFYENVLSTEENSHEMHRLRIPSRKQTQKTKFGALDLNIVEQSYGDYSISSLFREQRVYDAKNKVSFLPPLITDDFNVYTNFSTTLKNDLDVYVSACVADPIPMSCQSSSFSRLITSLLWSPMHKKALLGAQFKPRHETYMGKVGRDRTSFLQQDSLKSYKYGPPTGYSLFDHGILGDAIKEKGASILELPNYSRLVTDCAKMKFLDKLLAERSTGGHRVLIFCQMTKMLDILEDFLCWRKYTYFRMDGSTNLQDRRFMVEEFQKNNTIFAFLLSTRAGGLGVNLTAADTVIFYDNDWNPTIDAQAQDRAHRIGQTKPVSVYRLITKGTVEEKIVKRAKQKQTVQSTVYGGNALKADVFRPKDVVDMLLDEDEEHDLKERQQKFLRTRRVKKGGRPVVGQSQMDGDSQMIDTTSAAIVSKKESPTKVSRQSAQKDDGIKSKKSAALSKKQMTNNLFATIKTGGFSGLNNGPSASVGKGQQGNNGQDEDMEDYQEDDDLEEEDAEQKLLEILEREDEDEGVAIEYVSGDEAEVAKQAKLNGKSNGAAGSSNLLMNGGDEDEDDLMGDDY